MISVYTDQCRATNSLHLCSLGMPRSQADVSSKGQLLIKFQVEFPHSQFASAEALTRLSSLLPPAPPVQSPPSGAEPEHVTLSDFDPAELRASKSAKAGGRREAYDEDEDDDEPRQRSGPQCAAQ